MMSLVELAGACSFIAGGDSGIFSEGVRAYLSNSVIF